MHLATKDYAGSGEPVRCEAGLTFEGFREDLGAFAFQETMEQPSGCADALLAIAPMPGDYAIGVEEYWEDRWGSFGALLNEDYHIGYP